MGTQWGEVENRARKKIGKGRNKRKRERTKSEKVGKRLGRGCEKSETEVESKVGFECGSRPWRHRMVFVQPVVNDAVTQPNYG